MTLINGEKTYRLTFDGWLLLNKICSTFPEAQAYVGKDCVKEAAKELGHEIRMMEYEGFRRLFA